MVCQESILFHSCVLFHSVHISHFMNSIVLGHLAYFQFMAISNSTSGCIIVPVVMLMVITSSSTVGILVSLLRESFPHTILGANLKGIMMS